MSEAGDQLAASRRAILDQAQRRDRRRDGAAPPSAGLEGEATGGEPDDSGWLGGLGVAIQSWWRRHPAHMALELAKPTLAGYARRKPAQFLGIAAAAGAVILVARPWKLISATGLLMAVLKSSQVTGLVLSAMSAARYGKEPQEPL